MCFPVYCKSRHDNYLIPDLFTHLFDLPRSLDLEFAILTYMVQSSHSRKLFS